MKIVILAVGDKVPDWVDKGVQQFLSRMPAECSIQFKIVSAIKRTKNTPVIKFQLQEQEILKKQTPKGCYRIALDEHGASWTSEQISQKLEDWMRSHSTIAMYIGGADGFTEEFLKDMDVVWSLSSLTLPHMLVRVVLIEQIYRAWSIMKNHPYHRE